MRATDERIARMIITLVESGTDRIRNLGGECDDAERIYKPILDRLGLSVPPPCPDKIPRTGADI